MAEAARVRVQPGVRVPLSQGVVCEQGRGHLGGLQKLHDNTKQT